MVVLHEAERHAPAPGREPPDLRADPGLVPDAVAPDPGVVEASMREGPRPVAESMHRRKQQIVRHPRLRQRFAASRARPDRAEDSARRPPPPQAPEVALPLLPHAPPRAPRRGVAEAEPAFVGLDRVPVVLVVAVAVPEMRRRDAPESPVAVLADDRVRSDERVRRPRSRLRERRPHRRVPQMPPPPDPRGHGGSLRSPAIPRTNRAARAADVRRRARNCGLPFVSTRPLARREMAVAPGVGHAPLVGRQTPQPSRRRAPCAAGPTP